MSANGHFHLRVLPEDGKVPLNSHHSWIIEVESDVGDPVELRGLAVSGGMPAHGHGLPSQPRVTEYLGGGRYRVDGLMFNMHGEWQLNLSLFDGVAQLEVFLRVSSAVARRNHDVFGKLGEHLGLAGIGSAFAMLDISPF
jgi:hypothetical protein